MTYKSKKKNDNQKIIFTGPVGVGKTTAIAAVSDIDILKTDVKATDIAIKIKSHDHTTIAMDYGLMYLDNGDRIDLFGTPGQERFDFMWDILTIGGLGLILLIDDSRPNSLKDLEFFLNAFKSFLKDAPVVIGITKMDISNHRTLDHYTDYLKTTKFANTPIMEVDARKADDIKMLLMSLLFFLYPGLED
ncbi:MAG: ATP/GTP-binding protein [Proteobacteria bacterium]|nr:ATP/GTP-binding protein [Pseudomonadota bacterium]